MSNERILITGAGGFIGCRVAEYLYASGRGEVRAGVRRWSSAARLGRMPVEIVQCDVTDPDQVAQAMDGVDAVIHCAVGDASVTVEGTRNVFEAALAAGVRRVVHLSTIDVYGEASGVVSEDSPRRVTGSAYGDSKVAAEEVGESFLARGLPLVVLRPTLVYGPFSASWTVLYAERLASGSWFLPEEFCDGVCNLVYVDDLVQAIMLSLSRDEAVGKVFNISGAETPTWAEYFQALNDGMGLPPLEAHGATHSRLRAKAMMPVRKLAKFVLNHFRAPVMGIAQRSRVVKNAMRTVEQMIRQTPVPTEFATYRKRTRYDCARARDVLGYRPAVSMQEGTRLSGLWLVHHGYAPPGNQAAAAPASREEELASV